MSIQFSNVAANLPTPTEISNIVLHKNYSDSFLYSPNTLPTLQQKRYDEIENEMYQATKDAFCDSDFAAQKDEIQDLFEYHFKNLETICKYIVSESSDVYLSKDFKQADAAEKMLKILKPCKFGVDDILNSLTEDMSERLFVEFCERPI